MAKGKYKLLTNHYFPGDLYLDAGVVVGEGTPYPIEGPPSLNMEPLDPEAKQEIEKLGEKPKAEVPAPMSSLGNNPAQGPKAAPGPGLGRKGSGPPDDRFGLLGQPGLNPMEAKAWAEAAAGITPGAAIAAGIPAEEVNRVAAAEKAANAAISADQKAASDKAEADKKAEENDRKAREAVAAQQPHQAPQKK